jgi:hypothetical protein
MAIVFFYTSCTLKKLLERLQRIGSDIVLHYRKYIAEHEIAEEHLSFSVIGKQFFDKMEINRLFKNHVKKMEDGSGRVFVDKRRCHKTDGIILTPVLAKYTPFPTNAPPILKWKYPDLLSVDFKMHWNGNDWTLA